MEEKKLGTCHVVPKLDIEMLLLNLAQAQNIFTITLKSAHNKQKTGFCARRRNVLLDLITVKSKKKKKKNFFVQVKNPSCSFWGPIQCRQLLFEVKGRYWQIF